MRAVLVGVLAGLLVSAVVVLAVLLALPSEPLGRVADPSPSPSPERSSTPGGPSVSPGSSGSPSGSGSPGPSPAPPGSGSPEAGLRIGDAAPPLVVPQLGGGSIDLSTLRGRPVWVNFTASWCPPCRDELPLMERIQDQLGERMTIVAIDVREDPDTVASLASELSLTLPVGLDRDGSAQQAWAAYALPVHYWVDVDGRIRHVLYGGPGPDQFVEGVRTVLPDAEIEL